MPPETSGGFFFLRHSNNQQMENTNKLQYNRVIVQQQNDFEHVNKLGEIITVLKTFIVVL